MKLDTAIRKVTGQTVTTVGDPIFVTLAAAGRYLVAIISGISVAVAAYKAGGFVGFVSFFQDDPVGKGMVAALVGLVTIGWGLYKTHKRAQVADAVAKSPEVEALAKK